MPTVYRILVATLGGAILTAAILCSSGLASAQTRQDPQRSLWLAIKGKLSRPDGEEYFKSTVKGSAVPYLNGILLSGSFNDGVSKLVLNLADSKNPEVTLILHNGDVKVMGEPNAQIEFQGVAIEFTKDPFMLTFEVTKDQVGGWTGKGAAPATPKKAGPATTKKKAQ